MRWDYPPPDINLIFPGLGEIIIIIIFIIIFIIIIIIIFIIIVIVVVFVVVLFNFGQNTNKW